MTQKKIDKLILELQHCPEAFWEAKLRDSLEASAGLEAVIGRRVPMRPIGGEVAIEPDPEGAQLYRDAVAAAQPDIEAAIALGRLRRQ